MDYRWRPLDKSRQEIRVLILDAGIGEASLSGQLQHVFLDEPNRLRYETISYAWGATALVGRIRVSGRLTCIPASTVSALRCMRLSNEPRALWIDCICIDQQDDSERNHQVAIMSDIYSNSQQTLSDIGEDDGTVGKAFEDISSLYEVLNRLARGTIDLSQLHHTSMNVEHMDFPRLESTALPIRCVLMRPYFRYARVNSFHVVLLLTWLRSLCQPALGSPRGHTAEEDHTLL